MYVCNMFSLAAAAAYDCDEWVNKLTKSMYAMQATRMNGLTNLHSVVYIGTVCLVLSAALFCSVNIKLAAANLAFGLHYSWQLHHFEWAFQALVVEKLLTPIKDTVFS